MNAKDTSEPAFPVLDDSGGRLVLRAPGMTLRDHHFICILQTMLGNIGSRDSPRDVVRAAYALADIAIEERAK